MIKCAACDGKVSTEAIACPHCGHPQKSPEVKAAVSLEANKPVVEPQGDEMFCPNCQYVGKCKNAQWEIGDRFWTVFFLLQYIVPGLAYIWLFNKQKICPQCNSGRTPWKNFGYAFLVSFLIAPFVTYGILACGTYQRGAEEKDINVRNETYSALKAAFKSKKFKQVVSGANKYIETDDNRFKGIHDRAAKQLARIQSETLLLQKKISTVPETDNLSRSKLYKELMELHPLKQEYSRGYEKYQKMVNDAETQKLLAGLKTIPTDSIELIEPIYAKLSKLNPDNKEYSMRATELRVAVLLAQLESVSLIDYGANLELYEELSLLRPNEEEYKKQVISFQAKILMFEHQQQIEADRQKKLELISDLTWERADSRYSIKGRYTKLQKETFWQWDKGKLVKWSGNILSVGETWGNLTIQVKMNPDSFSTDVFIRMKESEKSKAMSLMKGDRITFVGVLHDWGSLVTIKLSDGEIWDED